MKENRASTKSVGIWIRVSTDDQAQGDSPKHHEDRAREYCKWNGWKVMEVYDLAGVSGKTVMEHPETKRMLADIKRGHISGLIFSKLARLARNTKELLDFSDLFRDAGADMISLQEKIDTSTPAGRLFYTMIAALSQWEREEITDRLKASYKVRAKLGKRLGGAAPYGYTWNGDKLEINPAEAPIRKLMYELFAENKRRKSVATQLNKLGYRTRNGSKFSDTTVNRLIQDWTAKGIYRSNFTYGHDNGNHNQLKPKSEWTLTPITPIVSEELWNRCNEILDNPRQKLGPKPVHLFAGILQCGCGAKMYVQARSPKYVCLKCRNKIPIQDMETTFREELEDFFVSKQKIEQHLTSASRYLTEKKEQLAAHTKQIEKVRGEMKKVYQLFQTDAVTPETFGKLYRPLEEQDKALSAELPRLQGEIDALEVHQISGADVISEATQLHQLWPKFDVTQKRRIIESIVEKIVVSRTEINVTYWSAPSSEQLTKEQRHLKAAANIAFTSSLSARSSLTLPLSTTAIARSPPPSACANSPSRNQGHESGPVSAGPLLGQIRNQLMFLGRAIGRIPSPYLQETRDYIENIRANGGGIQVSSLQAVDLFVRTSKDAGFWGDLMEVYPICGNDLTTAMVKLKYVSNPLLTAVNMVAADYQETGVNGGIAGNGTTKYVNSNFPQNALLAAAHMSVYLRDNEAGGAARYWFAANTSTPTIEQTILGTPNGSIQQGMLGGNSATASTGSAPTAGFYYAERNSPTDIQLWYQGASVASSAVSTTPAYQNLNLFICARNANGVASNWSAKKISFCSVGVPLTTQERATFYNAVVALQTALNRNV